MIFSTPYISENTGLSVKYLNFQKDAQKVEFSEMLELSEVFKLSELSELSKLLDTWSWDIYARDPEANKPWGISAQGS